MALALFRTYVLLIVLCIFITLIDKSQQGITISAGCKIFLAKNNKIILPQGFKVQIPDGFRGTLPTNWLNQTTNGPIVELPEGFAVTIPEGFEANLPAGMSVPPNGYFDNSGGVCKLNLSEGWTITPTQVLKDVVKATDGTEEGVIDIVFKDGDAANCFEIAIEAEIPKCKIILPPNNRIVLPKGFTINPPVGRLGGVLPQDWLKKTEEGSVVNLPEGYSVTLPKGFKIAPSKGNRGVLPKGWLEHAADGTTIMKVPDNWTIQPTDNLEKNPNKPSIDIKANNP